MTKSHCVACYFWNNYTFPYTALSSMNPRSSLLSQRQQERRRHCPGLVRRTSATMKSTRQAEDCDYREELTILEMRISLWKTSMCMVRLPFFTVQYVPGNVYPLTEGSRNQVLHPCHFHCKFVYDPRWPYFLLKSKQINHSFHQVNNDTQKWQIAFLTITPHQRLVIYTYKQNVSTSFLIP